MKKFCILVGFACLTLFAIAAAPYSLFTVSRAEGETYYNGTTRTKVASQVNSNLLSIAGSVSASNYMGLVQRPLLISASSFSVYISGVGDGAGVTNPITYVFQKSPDSSNWFSLSNITISPNGTTTVSSNYTLTLGDYGYVRCYDISNNLNVVVTNPTAWKSNVLLYYFKQ